MTDWFTAKAGIVFAAISGAIIHVTLFWTNPVIAARQFVACCLFGVNFGAGLYSIATHYIAAASFLGEGAFVCATGLCGVYLTEGLVLMARRWSNNPVVPWRKP